MTQKRGLGRGLGALIPGAGSSPAPEQELRTRTRPQEEGGSAASSTRPVDMFFSGEKVSSEDAPQRGGARDLATGMARAAAERRGRTAGRSGSSSTAKRSGAGNSSGGADASGSGAGTAAEASTTSKGTAAQRGTSSSAGTGSRSTSSKGTASKDSGTASKGTTSKSTASKSTTSKSTVSKGTASKSTSATSAPSTTAKSSGAAKSTGTVKSTSSSRTSSPARSTSSSKGASSPAKRSTGAKSAAVPTAAADSTGTAEGTAASKDASATARPTSAPTTPTPAPATGGAVDETAPVRTDEVPTVASSSAEQEQASSQAAPAAAENEATAPASSTQDAQPETDDAPEEAPQAGSAESEAPLRGEDSPIVDVEAVEYTRVRDTAPSEDAEPAAPAEPSTTELPAAAPQEAPAAQNSSAPADEHPATDEPAETDSEHAAAVGPDGDARDDAGEAPSGAAGQSDAGSERAPLESQSLVSVPGAEFAEIPIHEVRENPRNPRTMFDEEELDELAYSLREVGVLQPVVVRPIPVTEDGESFELVMGERRWRAARRAGLTAIPAIIRETSDDDLLRDALLENLHRTQLNPLEEANAYQQLLDDFGCTQDELGERIGRSRPQITNTLRLLRLPALVQRRLASGAISAGHARALLSLDDPTLMEELAQRIVSEGLSVRAVERLVARGGQQQAPRTVRRSTYDPHVVDLTSRLSNRLEAPVRIDVGKRKGKITLEFTNLEDLERLMENMGLELPAPE
ncbi:ParB/RepB/Spo0J family partition protein [Brachybacterium paraconglomeratum]|uniref:ParB/RepB/Spo0J family partition protein n=1 Tax=Brachybacterium paraconglomeratum TaxID=173362 RepID=UPI0022B022E9|nr:ParB/RepB/Spo0J family partition protein [Brachybacterium paraconglomeratum]MCZ4326577.1 ParB/RepB/Spo0J family partition protein [Brachybacterium paraconglomeratum]